MRSDAIARRPMVLGLAMVIACAWGRAMAQDPHRSADELLRLVPADASLAVTVEGLRDQVRSVAGSRLIADLRRLPTVRSWLESEACRNLERSGAEVEALLGVRLAELRDQLLGEAVVLVLRLPPGVPADPGQARGLLLLRARDPALLERLVSTVNAAQRESGELKRVEDRRRGKTTYHVREFPEGSGRPSEYYVSYADGIFAFSNSEEMIQGVVDRKSRGPDAASVAAPGLGESPRWLAVRRRLPEHPLSRLYVDPRAVERLLALAPPSEKPADAPIPALLRRHLAAVDSAGAALIWRPDAIVVHAVETLDASRVDAWFRRWAADARRDRPELRRVPRTAMAIASAHIDGTALREAVYLVVPEAEHQRLRSLESLLTGLMLGQDFASRILPRLGPGVVAYLDAPTESAADKVEDDAPPRGRGSVFPLVIVASLSDGGTDPGGRPDVPASDAIENALRTLLTMISLDEKRGQGRAGLATSRAAGVTVTTLGIPISFAFAIDRAGGRLVLGTSATSVARYLEAGSDPEAGARFREWQAAAFPGFETFACVDLDALTRHAGQLRPRLARRLAAKQGRPVEEVEGDLGHVLAFARLFRAAFVAGRIEPDASAIHRRLGLLLHESQGHSPTPP